MQNSFEIRAQANFSQMYIWVHDKYSSTSFKQRQWQRKIVLIWQNYFHKSNHVCQCGVVVKELLAPADKPGSTPGDAVSVSSYRFFSLDLVWSLFQHCFSFWPFFLYSHCWPCWSCTWIKIDILTLSAEFYFGKGFQKLLICILAELTTR